MKGLLAGIWWRSFTTLLMFSFMHLICWGQDSGSLSTLVKTTTTATEHTEWYAAPWVWIAGGIIVILLLAAIISGGRRSSSSRTTITHAGTTRTMATDSDEG